MIWGAWSHDLGSIIISLPLYATMAKCMRVLFCLGHHALHETKPSVVHLFLVEALVV